MLCHNMIKWYRVQQNCVCVRSWTYTMWLFKWIYTFLRSWTVSVSVSNYRFHPVWLYYLVATLKIFGKMVPERGGHPLRQIELLLSEPPPHRLSSSLLFYSFSVLFSIHLYFLCRIHFYNLARVYILSSCWCRIPRYWKFCQHHNSHARARTHTPMHSLPIIHSGQKWTTRQCIDSHFQLDVVIVVCIVVPYGRSVLSLRAPNCITYGRPIYTHYQTIYKS